MICSAAPICTKLSPITEVEEGIQVCELKHFKGVVLATSASLRWYMKEECLEIQLWFRGTDPNTAKKDRLLGTAYMNMSTLIGSQKDKHKQIRLEPLSLSSLENDNTTIMLNKIE